VLLDKNNVDVFKVAGTSESFSAFLVSLCSSEGILPLRIGAASTKIYIERGADWCGQGKNNSFFEGCGMSTCHYSIRCMYYISGREITKCTAIDGVYMRSWPTLHITISNGHGCIYEKRAVGPSVTKGSS
jgi:hypothetical protein